MILTTELLSDLLAALRSNEPQFTENRKLPRVGFSGQVQMILPGNAEPCLTRVRDISQDGIGLLMRVQLKKGDEIIMLLETKGAGPKFIRCTVRHCRKAASNLYNIGVKFQDPPGVNAG